MASNILDLLRFLSAVVVFLYHFGLNIPGYQAVMVFFVLSGYFISISVLKDIKQGNWSWKSYLIKRTVRLYIVLIPALVLTYIWAKLQIHYFGGSEFFTRVLDLKTLIGNLMFLQSIEVKQFGLNGPLWSLSYEFWYYILFPCMVLIFHSKKTYIKLGYLTLFLAISFFVGKQIMIYYVIWLLGVAIALIKPFVLKNHFLNYFVLFAAIINALLSTKWPYSFYPGPISWVDPYFIPDFYVGVSFAFLIYWVNIMFNRNSRLTKYELSKKLAGFSYTLYLVHYPLLYFWKAMIGSTHWGFELKETYLIKIVYLAIIVFYSYVLALLTENRTSLVTHKILNYRSRS